MMNKAIRNILVVDDHPVVRSGIIAILARDPTLRICCEAGSEKEVLEKTSGCGCRIDLAIIDLSLSKDSGFSLFRKMKNIQPGMKMLVFSLHDETIYAEKVLKAGAHGYLMKGEPGEKLLEAINVILGGNLYVSSSIHELLLQGLRGADVPANKATLGALSQAELIVLGMIGNGMTVREIASHLNRSSKTIDVHRSNIKRKLNIVSNTALMQFAIQWIS